MPKKTFKQQPGQMRLLIVVDKLLTGFDAPSATYLYIDKKMRDHGLFQAICRVNRLDGDDKEYGYIIDYKDLFHSLEDSINDYSSGAFDAYDAQDVQGLLSNRLDKAKERLEETREMVKALCEPVLQPREEQDYIRYFCGDALEPEDLKKHEAKRVALYKQVAAFARAYANLANELQAAGYTATQAKTLKTEVQHYTDMRQVVKNVSGDAVDTKQYEPAMRHLLDIYVRANDSQKVIDFAELGLIELVIARSDQEEVKPESKKIPEAMAETIENNVRKVIIDDQPINPKYYEKMSELLDALIKQRRAEAISYAEYLQQIKSLAEGLSDTASKNDYPNSMDTQAKRSLYDNLAQNEELAIRIDTAVRYTKKAAWKTNRFKTRKVEKAVRDELGTYSVNPEINQEKLMDLIKKQSDYD